MKFVTTDKILINCKDGKIREFACPIRVFSTTAFLDIPANKTAFVQEIAHNEDGSIMFKINGQLYDHRYFRLVFESFLGLKETFWIF